MWDGVVDVDVVVLGSGAAGLTAAVTAAEEGARVAVFEKADQVGGTTGWPGGHVWIPSNPHVADVGASDSREEALTYIMSLKSGAIGTKGGPVTDVDARVLDHDGNVIPGLYAAGNTMASAFGMTYGGPGGTLGPAMTFGYLAGRHAASRAKSLPQQ